MLPVRPPDELGPVARVRAAYHKLELWLHLTLARKIALSLLVLTGLVSVLVLHEADKETYQLLLDIGRAQARVFLTGLEREIQLRAPDLNPSELNYVITTALDYEPQNIDFQVEHLFVLDREGRVIASNQPEHLGSDLGTHPYAAQAIQENRVILPDDLTYVSPVPGDGGEARPTIDVVMPLHIGDTEHPVGAIELELDLTASSRLLKVRYWDLRRQFFATLVLLMVVFGTLSFLVLWQQIIGRVGEMARVARSIAHGDFKSRVRDMGSDEIGGLAASFNQMTDSLEAKIADLKQTQLLAMTKLAELAEKRDPDTGAHLQRMPLYCRALAEELRKDSPYASLLDDAYIQALVDACPLHDIGKTGIPDSILLKPGPLTPEEFALMRGHPLIGGDVLSGAEFLSMARDMALCHHERYDGSGYPNGLCGDEIPLSARILALADTYDALTSRRVYKEAFSHEKAFELISEPVSHQKASEIIESEGGRRFDPYVMRAFLRCEARFREIRRQFDA
jgi:response regulator RpfG family c-di-GMP phosphodiesterase